MSPSLTTQRYFSLSTSDSTIAALSSRHKALQEFSHFLTKEQHCLLLTVTYTGLLNYAISMLSSSVTLTVCNIPGLVLDTASV